MSPCLPKWQVMWLQGTLTGALHSASQPSRVTPDPCNARPRVPPAPSQLRVYRIMPGMSIEKHTTHKDIERDSWLHFNPTKTSHWPFANKTKCRSDKEKHPEGTWRTVAASVYPNTSLSSLQFIHRCDFVWYSFSHWHLYSRALCPLLKMMKWRRDSTNFNISLDFIEKAEPPRYWSRLNTLGFPLTHLN